MEWSWSSPKPSTVILLKKFLSSMHLCCILFLLCSRVIPALLPRLKLPCSDPSPDLMALIIIITVSHAGGRPSDLVRASRRSSRTAHGAVAQAAGSDLGNFPPCHRGLGCSEVRSQTGTEESESGLKMLRDQRGKVGRGRVCALGGGLGEHKWGGRFVLLLAFQSCAI